MSVLCETVIDAWAAPNEVVLTDGGSWPEAKQAVDVSEPCRSWPAVFWDAGRCPCLRVCWPSKSDSAANDGLTQMIGVGRYAIRAASGLTTSAAIQAEVLEDQGKKCVEQLMVFFRMRFLSGSSFIRANSHRSDENRRHRHRCDGVGVRRTARLGRPRSVGKRYLARAHRGDPQERSARRRRVRGPDGAGACDDAARGRGCLRSCDHRHQGDACRAGRRIGEAAARPRYGGAVDPEWSRRPGHRGARAWA